jgi:hypothetical protein
MYAPGHKKHETIYQTSSSDSYMHEYHPWPLIALVVMMMMMMMMIIQCFPWCLRKGLFQWHHGFFTPSHNNFLFVYHKKHQCCWSLSYSLHTFYRDRQTERPTERSRERQRETENQRSRFENDKVCCRRYVSQHAASRPGQQLTHRDPGRPGKAHSEELQVCKYTVIGTFSSLVVRVVPQMTPYSLYRALLLTRVVPYISARVLFGT